MNPEQLAARWLADVKRGGAGAYWVDYNEALAAIARYLAPGDDAVLIDALLNEPGFDKDWREAAAARLSALTAQVSELTQERNGLLTTWAESRERHLAAEAEAATLRDRLARMEGALQRIADDSEGDADLNEWGHAAVARAALTDGGSNG